MLKPFCQFGTASRSLRIFQQSSADQASRSPNNPLTRDIIGEWLQTEARFLA
jgi:hypothetical protein